MTASPLGRFTLFFFPVITKQVLKSVTHRDSGWRGRMYAYGWFISMYGKSHANIIKLTILQLKWIVSHSKPEAFHQHWHTEHRGGSNGADAEGFVNPQGSTLHGLVSASPPCRLPSHASYGEGFRKERTLKPPVSHNYLIISAQLFFCRMLAAETRNKYSSRFEPYPAVLFLRSPK